MGQGIIPDWTVDVRAMKEADAVVRTNCPKCSWAETVDLDTLISTFGDRFSLWSRRPPCPKCKVGKLMFYASLRGSAVWPTQLSHAPASFTQDLHDRWRAAWPRQRRDAAPICPILHAVGGHLVLTCPKCPQLQLELPAAAAVAWGAVVQSTAVTTNDLYGVFRQQCGDPACACDLDLIEGRHLHNAYRGPSRARL